MEKCNCNCNKKVTLESLSVEVEIIKDFIYKLYELTEDALSEFELAEEDNEKDIKEDDEV
jgi:hypothetical protein